MLTILLGFFRIILTKAYTVVIIITPFYLWDIEVYKLVPGHKANKRH